MPVGLSSNAQYALFESSASDLVAGDTNNATDVFLRDLIAGTNLLVSVSTNGRAGNGASRGSVMTPDGRYVAFVSEASNLVAGDTTASPTCLCATCRRAPPRWSASGATAQRQHCGSRSECPDITPDGRYVAFYSTASNLVPGVVNSGDIYVRDLISGTTTWASSYALTAVQLIKAHLHGRRLQSRPERRRPIRCLRSQRLPPGGSGLGGGDPPLQRAQRH